MKTGSFLRPVPHWWHLWLGLLATFVAAHPSVASPMTGVAVRMMLEVPSPSPEENAEASLSGTFLPSTPTSNDQVVSVTHTSEPDNTAYAILGYSAAKPYVRVEPFKEYTLHRPRPTHGRRLELAPPSFRFARETMPVRSATPPS